MYRVYVTDTLQQIAKNVAPIGDGAYIGARWYDVVRPKPVDERTGEQIVADVVARAGITLTSGKEAAS